MRPRASRIPGLQNHANSARTLHFSSRASKWLEDDHLVKLDTTGNLVRTDWKRQYKLRHNWSRGRAHISETQLASQPSTPPLLLRLCDGIVITADAMQGLRAWSLKRGDRIIANTSLSGAAPTSLAVDSSEPNPQRSSSQIDIAVGFSDGSFAIYTLKRKAKAFQQRYYHAPSSNGMTSAIAYAAPYLLTMTLEPLLSLYLFSKEANASPHNVFKPPILLSSLRSHTTYPPISLAIRVSTSIVASIAYAMPTWMSKWSVGLQEMRLTLEGSILECRIASSATKCYSISRKSTHTMASPARLQGEQDEGIHPPSTEPTSLSYNHPYLLTAHPDNTLTLYMVKSSTGGLSIGPGTRLWGHTSSVSGAQVGDRGKAVSVSTKGNELRVWELEGGILSQASRKRAISCEFSVQVREEGPIKDDMWVPPQSLSSIEDLAITKGWVAFDEEKVVLLREKSHGAQALVIYDFS